MDGARRAEVMAGGLSMLAGGIHGGVAPAHFAEWWGYGLFFVAAAAGQAVLGLLLLTRGTSTERGFPWAKVRGSVYAAGAIGNLAIVAMWLVSRTTGIPWFGPEAGQVEPVGPADAFSKALEAAAIALLAWLWLTTRRAADMSR